MGLPPEASYATLRFTLGRATTEDEIERATKLTRTAVAQARRST